jgi:DNA-binding XRE family transcriptional regulator
MRTPVQTAGNHWHVPRCPGILPPTRAVPGLDMRRQIADWTSCALAIAILAFGGLVVVKPAVDNWDELYRANPFASGTTTETVVRVKGGKPVDSTTKTTESSSSFTERVLGNSGLLFLRLVIVALSALLAAAVLHRALLGAYGLRVAPSASGTAPAAAALPRAHAVAEPDLEPEPEVLPEPELTAPELPAAPPARNGVGPVAETGNLSLAPAIAKLVSSRREELGLSQRELAKRAGLSHTVISRIESGEHSPSRKTLERLADVLA